MRATATKAAQEVPERPAQEIGRGRKVVEEKLLNLLYKNSFKYDPSFGFLLSSGKKSDIYVDVKKTVLTAEGMVLTGRALYEKLKDVHFHGIGGLTLGADPIAYTAAMICNLQGKPADVFIVRKEAKKHGTQKWIEGSLKEGSKVVVVDDVVTTGASTIKAIEHAKEAGFDVVKAVVIVDREEENGRANIEKFCPFEALFTRTDLIQLWEKSGKK